MKIVVITALPEESAAITRQGRILEKSRLNSRARYRVNIAGHEIILVEAGMGTLNAGWAATALAVEKPDLMISAGFGGAVVAGLSVGDVVLAERIQHRNGQQAEEVEAGFYGRNAVAGQLCLPQGTFITCDVILGKRELARALSADIRNPVVEMESAAIARVAALSGIPFLAVRAISDPWDEELNFSIDDFCDETKRIRPAKVLATILRRPAIIPQLIRLACNSRVAAGGLGKTMARLLSRI